MEIQGWITELRHLFPNAKGDVTRRRYAPHSIDHFKSIFSGLRRLFP